MGNEIQKKAKLILAGLVTMPVMAHAAATSGAQPNGYCSPGDLDCRHEHVVPSDLSQLSGLSEQEIKDIRNLVSELNKLDVVEAKEIITQAERIPYRYNLPAPGDVQDARAQNLARLAKLRLLIEAAK